MKKVNDFNLIAEAYGNVHPAPEQVAVVAVETCYFNMVVINLIHQKCIWLELIYIKQRSMLLNLVKCWRISML